eukprot:3290951-Pyramimonas_sp.AAC.1
MFPPPARVKRWSALSRRLPAVVLSVASGSRTCMFPLPARVKRWPALPRRLPAVACLSSLVVRLYVCFSRRRVSSGSPRCPVGRPLLPCREIDSEIDSEIDRDIDNDTESEID